MHIAWTGIEAQRQPPTDGSRLGPVGPSGKWTLETLLATCTLAFSMLGAACADPSPSPPPPACQCNLGQLCVNNECIDLCPTGDCPVGKVCIDGYCMPELVCTSDADCPGGRCVEGGCFVKECEDGQTRDCTTECGAGTEYCRGSVWRGCDAQVSHLEVCGDDVDNDCDGAVDEDCAGCQDGQDRPCETECGAGTERCVGAEWRGCSAERPRFEICGDEIDNDCDGTVDEECDGCADGETRECSTDCGVGEERCLDRTWGGCTAPRPVDEVCDGVDNDCDGAVDEEIVRDCSNACGSGTETCVDGDWSGCSALQQCACNDAQEVDQQICGACGFHTRTCVSGSWSQWGECQEAGECMPGQDDSQRCGLCGTQRRVCTSECLWGEFQSCLGEGSCEVGSVETEGCGTCGGTHTRTCDAQCQPGEWGQCEAPANVACTAGDTEERPCEMCGIERRTCGDSCEWEPWGECERGACEPGTEDARVCGACRVELRTCSDTCEWSEYGPCLDQGQCASGQTDTGECGNCGTRTRFCTPECVWGEWNFCVGEGECAPAEVEEGVCGSTDEGTCEYGTTVRTCDTSCTWNDWGSCLGAVEPTTEVCGDGFDQDCDGSDLTAPDAYEPNDSCATAYDLGEDPDGVVVMGTIDTAADSNDYFKFYGVDNTSVVGLEYIDVTLTDVPFSADYDLYLYKGSLNCQSGVAEDSSTAGAGQDETITYQESFGSDQTDTFYLRVKRFSGNSCEAGYVMTVTGLR